ncbi:hypothetical protein NW754_002402 [Fusarium falciforme]|uniref:Uncharacterized protein n=1 Tax=Fusarium falciforme TaxID=195108 RepID=A0A9W8QWJ4_9HYPO|nr:hypothetical protein NW754_002402 [Fusarium falciforme]KAJ4180429.1 hypothetical protein NW755_011724 [Fusarium falciforme]KAJ4196281.1 hypothetical protein NW767_009401 [Fusarium falciforme]KAJ4240399.1 hypothetical protein NW757_012471 [Fusarium falciforme]
MNLVNAAASTDQLKGSSVDQFQRWFPQYRHVFENITQANCSVQYDDYKSGVINSTNINYLAGGDKFTALTQPLIDCILENTSEYLKGTMTSAQVLLGIMPTIITFLGPSHDEIAMLSNVGRRPLLAAGMSLAAPSAYFSRAFEYFDPSEILCHHKYRREQYRLKGHWWALVSIIEYALVAGMCWNIVANTREVNQWTVSSLASDADFLPGLWLAFGPCIHFFSCYVFRLRIHGWRDAKMPEVNPEDGSFRSWVKDIPKKLLALLRITEFVPCATEKYVALIKGRKETITFLVSAWLESTFTILHLVFGTLVFSGTLFVGTKDALRIVGRYIAGVAVCRIILMYELAGLRESCHSIDGVELKPKEEKQPDTDAYEAQSGDGGNGEGMEAKVPTFTESEIPV